jgi:3-deoxy-D-manno-octulosonate 8-phosphate phosphatase (KDO 8-P phosphatase)
MAGDERTLADRCRAIALLVLDVDGVLTEGGVTYGDTEAELKTFNIRDGSGLKLWQRAGKKAALITGRTSPTVERRAREVGIETVVQGRADKLAAYRGVLAAAGVPSDQVCCVGDDVQDLPLLTSCGLAIAVADACLEARLQAHYVTRLPGGRGAVREVIELILRCQGSWRGLVQGSISGPRT